VIVYFVVFGIGTWYILKLMSHPPHPGEPQPASAPIRSAGITPAPSMDRRGADPRPDDQEEAK
jgi:cytochrome bd ubiquinol oxidase subunit I